MKIPLWMIFLAFSAFVAITSSLGLVYVSNQSPHGLVRADYYQAGLHLDEQRQREAGFDTLHIHLALKEKPDSLTLETSAAGSPDPALLAGLQTSKVTVFLQRPDDPSADRELVLQSAPDSISGIFPRWTVAATNLRKGRWNCRVVFEDQKQIVIENSFAFNAGG